MKKIFKIFLIPIAVLFVVVLIIFLFMVFRYSYKTNGNYISKITDKAITANNSSVCDKLIPEIMGPNPRIPCYSQVAIKNNNINACVDKGWVCFRSYFDYFKTEDKTICSLLNDKSEMDECYFQQNQVVQNIGFCSLIKSYTKQSSCYINLIRTESDSLICESYLPGQREKDICFERVAIASGNKIWCDKITDSYEKNICIGVNTK